MQKNIKKERKNIPKTKTKTVVFVLVMFFWVGRV